MDFVRADDLLDSGVVVVVVDAAEDTADPAAEVLWTVLAAARFVVAVVEVELIRSG